VSRADWIELIQAAKDLENTACRLNLADEPAGDLGMSVQDAIQQLYETFEMELENES
jgi:hypothetical protein